MAVEIRSLVQQSTLLFRNQAEYEGLTHPMTCYFAASIVLARLCREGMLDDTALHGLVVKLIASGVELQRPSMEVPLRLSYVGQLVAQMIASVMLRNPENYIIERKRQ